MIERGWEKKLEPLTVRVVTAVRITGLGQSRIYELGHSGDLETVKVGRTTLIQYQRLKMLTRNRPEIARSDPDRKLSGDRHVKGAVPNGSRREADRSRLVLGAAAVTTLFRKYAVARGP